MDEFKKMHAFTAKWEGGITDHPADPGGFTVYGVCRAFLEDFAKRHAAYLNEIGVSPKVTEANMRKITRDQAALIMKKEFYDDIVGLPFAPRFVTYDARVNCGRATGIKFLQRACQYVVSPSLAIDGIIGPKTIGAASISPREAALNAVDKRDDYYNSLVKSRPSMKVFLKGWLNRTNDLKKEIKKL